MIVIHFNVRIQVDGLNYDYSFVSGFVSAPNSNKIIVVSIIYKVPPKTVQVKARSSVKLEFLSSIQYSDPISSEQYHVERDTTKKRAIEVNKQGILEFVVS